MPMNANMQNSHRYTSHAQRGRPWRWPPTRQELLSLWCCCIWW